MQFLRILTARKNRPSYVSHARETLQVTSVGRDSNLQHWSCKTTCLPLGHELYAVEDETWINLKPLLPKQENKCCVSQNVKRHVIPRSSLTNEKSLLMICMTSNKISVKALPYSTTITSSLYIQFLISTGEK